MWLAHHFPGVGDLDPAFSDLSALAPETTRHMRKTGRTILLQEEELKGEHTKAIAASNGARVTWSYGR